MAQQAAQHLTPTYNWSLDQAFRHLTRTDRLSDSDALYEMEQQLRVEVRNPQGEPEYLYKNFKLHRDRHGVVLEGIRWGSVCKVAEQEVRAIRSAPSTPEASPLPSHKPTAPSKKRKRPTVEDRLISLMKDLDLKPGMLPHEVLRAVKQPYKNKYHIEPSQSAVTRAYDKYEAAGDANL
jgi:hypothetical protein